LGRGSRINALIAVLIWFMIIPMMMKVDFASLRHVGKRPMGLFVTLFVNWLVKPFSMALIAWTFFRFVFSSWVSSTEADQYIAGTIILAAAPCTAMVFVWSYLTDGDPTCTLVQVSVNDLIMLVLFTPIVALLVSGASSLTVPFHVLLYSMLAFIVIPLAIGVLIRVCLVRRHGRRWFEQVLLPRFAPVTMLALLTTLVCIFAFQADNITGKFLHVVLITIPILIQVYFNSLLACGLLKYLNVPYSIAAPGALIGASNFLSCRGDCDRAVRTWVGRCAGDRGRRLGRGTGYAFCVRGVQAYSPLVSRRDVKVKRRVLFLCTGNSARSQMAEGLLRHLAGDRFEIASAGTHPAGLNPLAVEVMNKIGIDISHHRSKRIDELLNQHFSLVITVCDERRRAALSFRWPLAPCIGVSMILL
jgi:ACR3 family arsenite transporter